MDILHPRRAYHRADTDDTGNQDGIEMLSVYSSKADSKPDYTEIHEYGSDYHLRAPDKDRQPLLEPSTRARWFSGWRTGAYSAACLALFSLIINIAAAAWLKRHPGANSNLVEVFNGSCDKVSNMDIWVHLLINAISTLLLGGSNYCMQCLCAPNRQEIDRAHAKGQFLDIGVPSYRNLSCIAWPRVIMWWILGLSSIPLHLMYNSAFYSSLTTNDYFIYVVEKGFLDGANATYPMSEIASGISYQGEDISPAELQRQISSNTSHIFEQLDTRACIQQYAQVFLADRRNLVFVTSNSTAGDSTVLYGTVYSFENSVSPESTSTYDPFDWICESDPNIETKIDVPLGSGISNRPPCDSYVSRVEAIAADWEPFGYQVDYCLAERTEQQCSFNGNLPIVLVVVVCNAVKAIIMLIVAVKLTGSPLITIGDAIESFLDRPDETTKGVCLLNRDQAALYAYVNPYREKTPGQQQWAGVEKIDVKSRVIRFRTLRWSKAASGRRWSVTIGLIVGALLMVVGFMAVAIQSINSKGTTLQDLGFGTVHASAVISDWSISNISDPSKQIIAAIFIANLPQAILSFLYLNLNGLLTSMWTALEFSQFAKERKFLRVSTPKARQRSTHFLQLPYKIALPLMTVSGLLHWLISQSIFLAVVAEYGAQNDLISAVGIASCGFSPTAMIMVLVVGTLLIVTAMLIGTRKYDSSMPLAGSCSAAIAAACHRPDWDVDAGVSAVQWGVVPDSGDENGVGHCCFTSGYVEPIQEGKQYGGPVQRLPEVGASKLHPDTKISSRLSAPWEDAILP